MPTGDRFVDVPRAAFESFFAAVNSGLQTRAQAHLWEPREVFGELTYDVTLVEEPQGLLKMVVYTSVAWSAAKARACGNDAIRVALVFCDANGRRTGVSSTTKVLRTGSVDGVLARLRTRMADAWAERRGLKRCARCGAPAYGDSGRCVVAECRSAGGRAA